MKKYHPAYFGVYLALACLKLCGIADSVLFWYPRVKLGLTNLVIVLVLYQLGFGPAMVLSCARVFLAGFLFGNLYSILYSLAGGVLSLLVMALVKKTGKLSIAGVSICGGIFHNVGQILVAMVVVENMSIAYYMPVLLISGVITGCLIGIAAGEVKRRLPGMNAGRQED